MATAGQRQGRTNLVLALLLLAYILNFLDRQILGILGPMIKAELHLSDARFGLLGGTAFALLYSVLGIPLAYLADRTSRSAVIAGALAVWSGFTALCGSATAFGQLFLYRVGVGVGEAGGVAPSYALVADYFPPERRARALAIFSLGVPIGLGGGSFIGAHLAAWFGWRAAFMIMGAIGVLLAPILRLIVRDPPRRAPVSEQAAVSSAFRIVARKPAFWLLAFGASASSLTGYGLALWTPSILMRSFNLDLIGAGNFLASLVIVGGCAGVFAGGWFADRLGRADRGWYARLPAIAWLITAPTFVAGYFAPNLWLAWMLLLIPNALNILWLGPITTAVQHLVPARMRATASASFLLINNLIGLGVGPWLIGQISDSLKAAYGADALRNAAVACCGFYFIAALLALLAVRPLRSAWVDEPMS
jgi:predicted MFS family arabinose efflux permease